MGAWGVCDFRLVDESTAAAPPAYLYLFEQFMASGSFFFRLRGYAAPSLGSDRIHHNVKENTAPRVSLGN